jgi:hypothetical protein
MRLPRITIASLLGIVAFVGVAFAALRAPTDAWDSTLLGLTLLMLITSALLAVHRRGDRGAFWLGFALFGWAYLVASLVPPVAARLPTTKALVVVRGMLARPEDDWDDALILTDVRSFNVTTPTQTALNPPGRWDVKVFQQPAPPTVNYIKRLVSLPDETIGTFVRIGHSLFALVFALVGALLSRRLYLGPGVTRRPATIASDGTVEDDQGRPAKSAEVL